MALRKRKGVYFLDVTVDGKRFRESLGTGDRPVAMIKARLRKRELAAPQTLKDPTIEEFRDEYDEYSKGQASAGERRNRKGMLSRLAREYPNMKLSKFSPRLADLFLARLADPPKPKEGEKGPRPVSAAGINGYIRTLRAAFNVAKRWKYVSENPFAGIPQRLVDRQPPRILSRKEIAAIMLKARQLHPEMMDVYNFALTTGLRRSEIVRLAWEDVDYERNIIVVHGKRKKMRYVPMLKKAKAILESRKDLPKPFPVTADHITGTFEEIRDAVPIRAVFHDFRRVFGSYLLARGIEREVVMKILGHEAFSTTDIHYFGLPPELVQRFDALESDFESN